MMIITLHTIDKTEGNAHLNDVIEQMRTMGAPVIRCFYNDGEGVYMAAEGCHRIEAAHRLGLTPVLDVMDIGDIDADADENPAPADILEEMGDFELSMGDLWNKIERFAVLSNDSQWYNFAD